MKTKQDIRYSCRLSRKKNHRAFWQSLSTKYKNTFDIIFQLLRLYCTFPYFQVNCQKRYVDNRLSKCTDYHYNKKAIVINSGYLPCWIISYMQLEWKISGRTTFINFNTCFYSFITQIIWAISPTRGKNTCRMTICMYF